MREWPIQYKAGILNFVYRPEKPLMIGPSETKHRDTNIDFPISPRKYIRYTATEGYDFPYAATFALQFRKTLTQISYPDGKVSTRVQVDGRLDFFDPPFFVTANILRSSAIDKTKSVHESQIADNLEPLLRQSM